VALFSYSFLGCFVQWIDRRNPSLDPTSLSTIRFAFKSEAWIRERTRGFRCDLKQAIQCRFLFTVPVCGPFSRTHNICGDDKIAVWEILLFVAKVLSALIHFVVSNSQILPPPEKESRQFISSLNRFK
jgi:hypothetical protein